MTFAYRLGTLRLDSDFELPELAASEGRSGVPADIVFRVGSVPMRLENPDHVAPLFQTKGRGECLLVLPGTGRLLIKDGREVTLEPAPGAHPIDIRAFATGPCRAVLWHQRGLLPLHASAVVIKGRVVALAGPSPTGKSTLAAALSAKGHRVVADDISVIDTSCESQLRVLPGFPRLRLWRDVLDHFAIATEELTRALSGRDKFLVDPKGGFVPNSQPLGAVVTLSLQNTGKLTIERLSGMHAVFASFATVHTRRPARALGLDADIFAALARFIPAGVSVWRFSLPMGPGHLDEALAKIVSVAEA